MPIKVLRTRSAKISEKHISLEAECKFTALGESSSNQRLIFFKDVAKIDKKLSEDSLASFKIDVVIPVNVLKELIKKAEEMEK